MTGHPRKDRENKMVRHESSDRRDGDKGIEAEQIGQDSRYGTTGIGQPGYDSRDRTAGIGEPG